MTDLPFLGIAEAAALLRAGALSPVEYAAALIDRVEKLDPHLHAFIRLTPDIALAQARQAEAEIAAGGWRGPLHGIPFGLKDIIDYAGLPTTAHSRILADTVAADDADVTGHLRAAGAVMLGKLALHEFALGGPSYDLPWPLPVNPWGVGRYAGGSSSGSAVAVAGGMLPAAIGTDTGGSIRNPAAASGITGMKPTTGRARTRGVIPLAYSLDHVGPMTRDVRDNALLLAAMTTGQQDVTGQIGQGVKGLRIGLVRQFHAAASPEQAAAVEAAADVLQQLGAQVSELSLPSNDDFSACCRLILRTEAFAIHRRGLAERAADYAELTRAYLLAGATVSGADYVDALRWRGRLTRQTVAACSGSDALLTVCNLDPAPSLDDADAVSRALTRHARHPFSITGQPAIAIPAGFTVEGLPLSIQIAGHHFQDGMVYRVAHAYEQATRWIDRRPMAA